MPESNSSDDNAIPFYSDPQQPPDFQLPRIDFPSSPSEFNLLQNLPIPKYTHQSGIENFILQVYGFFTANKECFTPVRAAQYLLAYSFQRDTSFLLHRQRLTSYESILQWLYKRSRSPIPIESKVPSPWNDRPSLRLPKIQFPNKPTVSLSELSTIAPFPKYSPECGTESFVQQCYFFFTQNRECFSSLTAARFLIINSFDRDMSLLINNQTSTFSSMEGILHWIYRETYSPKTGAEIRFKRSQPKSYRIPDLMTYVQSLEKLHFDTRISDYEAIRVVIGKIPRQYDMWIIPLYHYKKFSLFAKHLCDNLEFAQEREGRRR